MAFASRLVPRAVVQSDALRASAVEELALLAAASPVKALFVVGGRVASADPGSRATSVHPGWRDAVLFTAVYSAMPHSAGPDFSRRRDVALREISRRGDRLRRAFGGADGATYPNEARRL